MRNRTERTRFCPASSDGCEESTDMIWRSVESTAQPLRQMMIPKLRNGHLFRQELEFRIRAVRTGDTHATSGNSGERPGQRGVPGS